ncbi:MAG: dioxygenase [Chloroflexi bacterium]|nr:dioxygenase [Chloroflexota bacterium]
MPVIFAAHGAPYYRDGDGKMVPFDHGNPQGLTTLFSGLREWAKSLPRPRSVLMLSAHWEARPLTIGATRTVPLVYDFYGFAEPFYEVEYPAPSAPELAQRVRELVGDSQPLAEAPDRGLDHGAYTPMAAMYPDADVPVLQISLPTMNPRTLFDLGRTLAPLRQEGVLIVGSGFLTHNLRAVSVRPDAPTPTWAAEFDAWSADVLGRRDVDSLITYREHAPGVRYALPTHEHFVPAIVALGAAIDEPGETTFPITGFLLGSMTKRSVEFGS